MSVSAISVASAATQSQVHSTISIQVLKLAQQQERQFAALIEQVVATAQAIQDGKVDVYA